MKVLVTGVNGQLGYDVVKELMLCGIDVFSTGRREYEQQSIRVKNVIKSNYYRMDITNPKEVDDVFSSVRPDAVIHCAAWTRVDDAEDNQNLAKVWSINRDGTKNLALACLKTNCALMYISTDYVFDGSGDTPWNEDCEVFNPLNVYGETKLAGEQVIKSLLEKFFIVRISWVFGINGNNFVKTMLRVSQSHNKIRVICDQVGNPTYTRDLATLLVNMINTKNYGIYHASNEGEYISWYDFAREIFAVTGKNVYVEPVSTREYGTSIAMRPHNSRLRKEKLISNGFELLPNWKDALIRYIEELRQSDDEKSLL